MQSASVCRMLCGIVLMIANAGAQSVLDLNGRPADPLQNAHGRPAVLIFVRTDCPISNRYAPVIQDLSRKYTGAATFWLVYPGKTQTPKDIQEQLSRYGYHIAAVRDTRHELADKSEVKVTPEAALFDKTGKLVYHGRIDNWYEDFGRARLAATTHELDDAIRATLEGKAPKLASTTGIGCSLADLE